MWTEFGIHPRLESCECLTFLKKKERGSLSSLKLQIVPNLHHPLEACPDISAELHEVVEASGGVTKAFF